MNTDVAWLHRTKYKVDPLLMARYPKSTNFFPIRRLYYFIDAIDQEEYRVEDKPVENILQVYINNTWYPVAATWRYNRYDVGEMHYMIPCSEYGVTRLIDLGNLMCGPDERVPVWVADGDYSFKKRSVQ